MGILRITAAVALIVGAGLVHGAWTDRWGPGPALAAQAARYRSVPMTIGDWTATPFEIGPRERWIAGAEAWLARVYTNGRTGTSVSVLLFGGRPGGIASHTPEICYPGAGYVLGSPVPFQHRPRGVGFRTALATRGGAHPSALRIFWSWHASKGWAAPEEARWEFASEPTLSKLYVVRETGGDSIPPDRDPCNDFLEVFLPELDRAVFSPAG